ncbi:DUF1264 domain-containing protein [Microlunatus soli]
MWPHPVAQTVEHAFLADPALAYGKTCHTWQFDRSDFPFGAPRRQ